MDTPWYRTNDGSIWDAKDRLVGCPRTVEHSDGIIAAVNGYDAAQTRIAELEKALRLVLEQRDLSIIGRLHPMGELEIIALARATLAPEPQP